MYKAGLPRFLPAARYEREEPQFSPGNEAEFGMLADRVVQQDFYENWNLHLFNLKLKNIVFNIP